MRRWRVTLFSTSPKNRESLFKRATLTSRQQIRSRVAGHRQRRRRDVGRFELHFIKIRERQRLFRSPCNIAIRRFYQGLHRRIQTRSHQQTVAPLRNRSTIHHHRMLCPRNRRRRQPLPALPPSARNASGRRHTRRHIAPRSHRLRHHCKWRRQRITSSIHRKALWGRVRSFPQLQPTIYNSTKLTIYAKKKYGNGKGEVCFVSVCSSGCIANILRYLRLRQILSAFSMPRMARY